MIMKALKFLVNAVFVVTLGKVFWHWLCRSFGHQFLLPGTEADRICVVVKLESGQIINVFFRTRIINWHNKHLLWLCVKNWETAIAGPKMEVLNMSINHTDPDTYFAYV